MTTGRADLSIGPSLDRMEPVSAPAAVQGDSPPANGEGKPRRRPPLPAEASAEAVEGDEDRPEHRIDSLA